MGSEEQELKEWSGIFTIAFAIIGLVAFCGLVDSFQLPPTAGAQVIGTRQVPGVIKIG